MTSRNHALARSILFGLVTKAGGALIVFIGLPVIAHALPVVEYAAFLKGMSAASIVTLFFGAAATLSIRGLASALASGDPDSIREAEGGSAGLFLAAFGAAAGLSLVAGAAMFSKSGADDPQALVIACVTVFALAQGLLQWADAYRVASRTDHISSLWQLVGSLAMLGLLLAFGRNGLWAVALIYFGSPAIVQAAIFIQLRLERSISIKPTLRFRAFAGQYRAMVPLLVNSAAEYTKIFASGLIVAKLTGNAEYAKYVTIVLLIARLVNPVSLITRPLMPAYIDATHHGDHRWLGTVRASVAVLAVAGLLGALCLGAVLDRAFLAWLLPDSFGGMSRLETLLALLFLWGHGVSALLAPFYFAAGRTNLFCFANAGFVAIGVAAGALATMKFGASGMLAAMSGAVAATAACMAFIAVTQLLRVQTAGATAPAHLRQTSQT